MWKADPNHRAARMSSEATDVKSVFKMANLWGQMKRDHEEVKATKNFQKYPETHTHTHRPPWFSEKLKVSTAPSKNMHLLCRTVKRLDPNTHMRSMCINVKQRLKSSTV